MICPDCSKEDCKLGLYALLDFKNFTNGRIGAEECDSPSPPAKREPKEDQ